MFYFNVMWIVETGMWKWNDDLTGIYEYSCHKVRKHCAKTFTFLY